MKRPSHAVALPAALSALILVTACSNGSPSTAPPAASPAGGKGPLAQVCPNPTVIQLGWFPELERAWALQLIGPDGTIDAAKGTYSGPSKADPSLRIEVRSGGPFVGFQQGNAMLYQDRQILLADQNLDAMLAASKKFPTVAVAAPLEKGSQILFWDPAKHSFNGPADIKKSGAKVLVASNAIYMQALTASGVLDPKQVDYSYDGSPSRFVADPSLVNQGFLTAEPYQLAKRNPAWGKPVKYMLISDMGYPWYQGVVSARPDTVKEKAACLSKLVPLIQKAQVDMLANPEPMIPVIQRATQQMRDPMVATPEMLHTGIAESLRLGVYSNGSNNTIGDFDLARVGKLIDMDLKAFKNLSGKYPYDPEMTPDGLVTNQFIDTSIGLSR
ncbi:nitrate ABC transporter substrate-binding protein [Streptosporangium violaceochromogenes]|nr:nitrate ABC transporter substrate-binding protein [Streptosporangium violaceochromogenes]